MTWPVLDTIDIANDANSMDVEFGTAKIVRHRATFLLSDHRVPGSAIKKAKYNGLALMKAEAGVAPVTWLVEATHTLSWSDAQIDRKWIRPHDIDLRARRRRTGHRDTKDS